MFFWRIPCPGVGGLGGPLAPICRMRSSRFLASSIIPWNDSLEYFRIHIEGCRTSSGSMSKSITTPISYTYIQSRYGYLFSREVFVIEKAVYKVDREQMTQMVNNDELLVMVVLGLAYRALHLSTPHHQIGHHP